VVWKTGVVEKVRNQKGTCYCWQPRLSGSDNYTWPILGYPRVTRSIGRFDLSQGPIV
jgi:hypothetical protein